MRISWPLQFLFFIFSASSIGQTKINEIANSTDSLNFRLVNVDGKQVSLNDYKDAKGLMVVFTCNHCPFAKLYPQRLNALNEKYKKRGVPLIAISSTDSVQYEEDDFAHMVKYAKQEKFKFPYLYDRDQSTAKHYKAQKTPHAFVIWNNNGKWQIEYEGAIDDNGMHAKDVKDAYVANAVEALLAGKAIAIQHSKSIGCQIYYR